MTHGSPTRQEPASPASALARVFLQEDLNFLVTNRLPRRLVTRLAGRYSAIQSRRLTRVSIAVWRLFADDLRLHEARKREFDSLHDCFVRELRPGARPIDPDPNAVIAPCDAVVGANGMVKNGSVIQAKGFPYALRDLLLDDALVSRYEGGTFVTLRLKANMYHRFHAPLHCRLREVVYVSGDTWNVNPIALRRVESLFCKNERAVLDFELGDGSRGFTLVPVAAIVVASIHLHALGQSLDLSYRGPNRIPCDASYRKGDELGYFHAGSTIIAFADRRFRMAQNITDGHVVRVGEPLFHHNQT
jgi:phosphatidylserine decarboxylase